MYLYKINDWIQPVWKMYYIYWFIKMYWYRWAIGKDYISFDDWVEFKGKNYIEFFEVLLQLHLESAIDLDIKWVVRNEFWVLNKEFKKELDLYLESDNIFTKFNWNKKSYCILPMRMDWHLICKKIKYMDCIAFNIRVINHWFMNHFFSLLTFEEWFKDQDKEKTATYLYNLFLEKTDGKKNYDDMIQFSFQFSNYLEERRLILPILVELEEKGRLKIMNSYILKDYIYFEVAHIVDILEEEIIKTSYEIKEGSENNSTLEDIQKVEYTEEGVKINWALWKVPNAEKAGAFLKLVSHYFYNNDKYEYVSLIHLINYYEENREKFPLPLILKEKNIQNSYIKTINKKLWEKYTWKFIQMSRWGIEAKKQVIDI